MSYVYLDDALPISEYKVEVTSDAEGYVTQIESENMGVAASILGAGRETKESEIDLAVGIVLEKKVGDKVKKGDTLAVIHSNKENVEDVYERVIKYSTFGIY